MPTFDFTCSCGNRFEQFLSTWRAENPSCPACAAGTRRVPAAAGLALLRSAPADLRSFPQSWEGVGRGDKERLTQLRRAADRRRSFESANPEHQIRTDALAAHEGVFERNPLTYRELASRSAPSGDAAQGFAAAAEARTAASVTPSEGAVKPGQQ